MAIHLLSTVRLLAVATASVLVVTACSVPRTTYSGAESSRVGGEPASTPNVDRTPEVVIQLSDQTLHAGAASVVLDYALPAGYKVNEDAPSSVAVAGGSHLVKLLSTPSGDITGTPLPASIPVLLTEGSGNVSFDVRLIYCETINTALCLIDEVRYDVPVSIGAQGVSSQLLLNRRDTLPGG